jgi:mRNA interferase YafQ
MEKVSRFQKNYSKVGKKNNCHSNRYNPLGSNAILGGLQKQRENLLELKTIIESLVMGQPLDSKYKDHKLVGNWKGLREYHVEPDWLLIYRINGDNLELVQTGSHPELFDI